jgi:teichuronic acid biosynthesis glycosyltransferase TuaC
VDLLRDAVADVLAESWDADTVVKNSRVRSWEQVAEEVQRVFKNL